MIIAASIILVFAFRLRFPPGFGFLPFLFGLADFSHLTCPVVDAEQKADSKYLE